MFCRKQLRYQLITEKLIITTDEQPCNHAGADTRVILHLFHAASQGHKFALVRTVDSDVIILCLFFFVKLGFVELWVVFGTGKSIRYIPIHTLYVQLGPEKSQALLLFHAVNGCDTVPDWQRRKEDCLAGLGKRIALSVVSLSKCSISCNPIHNNFLLNHLR